LTNTFYYSFLSANTNSPVSGLIQLSGSSRILVNEEFLKLTPRTTILFYFWKKVVGPLLRSWRRLIRFFVLLAIYFDKVCTPFSIMLFCMMMQNTSFIVFGGVIVVLCMSHLGIC